MTVTYSPAEPGWLLVAAGPTAILYATEDAALATELLAALSSGSPVQAAVDVLTREGVTAAPAFALAHWAGGEADAVVVARGDASVAVSGATGDVDIDGRAVSTWQEQRVAAATSVTLRSGAADTVSLPLEAGAVWASAAEFGSVAVLQSTPVAAPTIVLERVEATTATPVNAEADSPEPESAEPEAGVPPVTVPPVVVPTVAVPPVIAPQAALPTPAENTITDLPEAEGAGYGHLFEETMVRSIEDAAVRPPDEAAAEAGAADDAADDEGDDDTESDEERAGDHDGLTVMSGDIAKLRKSRLPVPASSTPVPPAPKFVLELSTGGREPLTQPILVGRSPSVSKVSSGQVPRLVTIPGDQDISRNHAQFALEGDTVVVTDLHSRNGTSVILPGKSPQILRPGEPTTVIVGTVVDLGGGVTLKVGVA